ncbi:MAG: SpoIID/LytB domain-containing protein [Chitinispirillaceae bacterium]|nr:SpoIID/LytB domain-containing protein [Chitinispirillaceae bacterium]
MENSKRWQKVIAKVNNNRVRDISTLLFSLIFLLSCYNKTLKKNQPVLQKEEENRQELNIHNGIVDFAEAFSDTSSAEANREYTLQKVEEFQPFYVPTKKVRVALLRNVKRVVIYSVGESNVKDGSPVNRLYRFRGRLEFETKSKDGVLSLRVGKEKVSIFLPCTLISDNDYNFFEIGDTTYRGGIILYESGENKFTVVNYIDVEEYLRGVVPLEIGKRSEEEMEALKVQAIAARTYTYKKIIEKVKEPFDVVSSVSDQVYGGVVVEYPESDKAIKATKDLIMIYDDSIITAYYHSTCGGKTANVNDVWDKPSREYLCSVSDTDSSGKPWCESSTYYKWEESWPFRQFLDIVIPTLQKRLPTLNISSPIREIKILDRYSCGRIKTLLIKGNNWEYKTGGDAVRFILRRGVKDYPILRSANFEIVELNKNVVKISGLGYGHGVGMCQMGAIGRAKSGQNFMTILKSYYKGISIAVAEVKKE